jgi:hypothetical protein
MPSSRLRAVGRRPFVRRDGVDPVILPDAVDPKVPFRQALQAEARLLRDADRADVSRHHRRLHPVEVGPSEGERERLPHGPRRVPAPAPGLIKEVADVRVLPCPANHAGQGDPADELARLVLPDAEPERPVQLSILGRAGEVRPDALEREPRVRATRFPRSEELPVAKDEVEEGGGVRLGRLTQLDGSLGSGRGRAAQYRYSSFIRSNIFSASGMKKCSRGLAKGMAGMSGPPIRTTGASRSYRHSSEMVAEISAPAP